MSSLASGNRRRTAVASTCEAEWRSSSSGDIDMAVVGCGPPYDWRAERADCRGVSRGVNAALITDLLREGGLNKPAAQLLSGHESVVGTTTAPADRVSLGSNVGQWGQASAAASGPRPHPSQHEGSGSLSRRRSLFARDQSRADRVGADDSEGVVNRWRARVSAGHRSEWLAGTRALHHFFTGSSLYPSLPSSIDQPAAVSSLRRVSAPAQSLACFAAQRFSARAVIAAGISAWGRSAAFRSRPRAKRARSKEAWSASPPLRFTTVKSAPKAAGVFRSSWRAVMTWPKASCAPVLEAGRLER